LQAEVFPFLKDGQIRVLAILSGEREPTLPDVPTLKERGIDVVAQSWFALYGPAGVPASAIEVLYNAMKIAINDPKIVGRLAEMSVYPDLKTSTELEDRQKREINAFKALKGIVSLD